MKSNKHTNRILGLGCIAVALLVMLVWIPLDVETGLIEKVRRQVTIGDSLAPMLGTMVIGLGGVILVFQRPETIPSGVSLANLGFMAALLGLFAISFAVMRWGGPLAVQIAGFLTGEDLSYRMLRATAPWKFIGFLVGSSALIALFIASIEGRFSLRAVLIGLIASCALIALYDLPFDDLLLPPNGDV